jgi:hypothetical protein
VGNPAFLESPIKLVNDFFKNPVTSANFYEKTFRNHDRFFRKSLKIFVGVLSGHRGKRETLPTRLVYWEGYHSTLIRAQYGLQLPIFRSKRSPYRAPFKNKPKSAVFWQMDEIKGSRIAILKADLMPVWVFG